MIAEALRLLRTRKRLTQTAASKLEGAPDFRTLSHWETGRKMPSLKLLQNYLRSFDLDFCDLQGALDQVEGLPPKRLRDGLEKLELRLADVERFLGWKPRNPRPDHGRKQADDAEDDQSRDPGRKVLAPSRENIWRPPAGAGIRESGGMMHPRQNPGSVRGKLTEKVTVVIQTLSKSGVRLLGCR